MSLLVRWPGHLGKLDMDSRNSEARSQLRFPGKGLKAATLGISWREREDRNGIKA